jgi:hypothetical protein
MANRVEIRSNEEKLDAGYTHKFSLRRFFRRLPKNYPILFWLAVLGGISGIFTIAGYYTHNPIVAVIFPRSVTLPASLPNPSPETPPPLQLSAPTAVVELTNLSNIRLNAGLRWRS